MAGKLLVEGAVVFGREALAAVFLGETYPGKPGVEELALQGAVAGYCDEFLLVVLAMLGAVEGLQGAEIGLDPFARAQAEFLDGFDFAAHAANSFSICIWASHRRWSLA